MPVFPLSPQLFIKILNKVKCNAIYEAGQLQVVLNPPIPREEWEGGTKPARTMGTHPMLKLGFPGNWTAKAVQSCKRQR